MKMGFTIDTLGNSHPSHCDKKSQTRTIQEPESVPTDETNEPMKPTQEI